MKKNPQVKSFSKTASIAIALAISTSANSASLSYGGYTHELNTNIVTGNGLEWLRWDVTVGESIDSIQSQLNTLEGGGWAVASNTQMAQLLNNFEFGVTFDNDENTSQTSMSPWTPSDGDGSPYDIFIAMFGDTGANSGTTYCYDGECLTRSSAFFGHDLDNDGLVNSVNVVSDIWHEFQGPMNYFTTMNSDLVLKSDTSIISGVALVRGVSPVPVPAAAWLFGSGLVGLAGIARRKQKQTA